MLEGIASQWVRIPKRSTLIPLIESLIDCEVSMNWWCKIGVHDWYYAGSTNVTSDLGESYTRTSLWKQCVPCGKVKRYKKIKDAVVPRGL